MIGMEDEAEAVRVARRAAHDRPHPRQIVRPWPVMIGRERHRREAAEGQGRRDARIEQIGGAGLRVIENAAQPGDARRHPLARPSARPLDELEIALDVVIGTELGGGDRRIVRAARHQQGDVDPPPRERRRRGDRLLAARLAARPRPEQGIDQAQLRLPTASRSWSSRAAADSRAISNRARRRARYIRA
jgi:hypothetical protein